MDVNSYSYLPLEDDDLRLIALQPGETTDQIRIAIFHAPIAKAVASADNKRLTKAEILKAVAEPWEVYEIPEGRYCFFLDAPDEKDWIGPIFEYPGPELTPEVYAPRKWEYEGAQYEALSYTWGTELSNQQIQVVSEDTSEVLGSLLVLKNLESALRQLRLEDKPRNLWIDAICINQKDLEERSRQVQRMGDIYAGAPRVVVWLGPASENSHVAMRLLEHYGKQIEIGDDYTLFRHPKSEHDDWWRDETLPPYDENEWSAIVDLMKRPWFERVWTLQEIALANPDALMVCGEDAVKYYHLRRAFLSLALKAKEHPVRSRLHGREFIDCGKKDQFFIHMMNLMTKSKCFDPRDKVYGALHIMGPKLRDCITPSYTLPVEEVYMSVSLAYVETTKRLDFLCQRTRPEQDFPGPTWVPDFRQATKTVNPLPSNFLAAGMTAAEVLHRGGSVLKVTGLQHDKIRTIHAPMNDSDVVTKIQQLSPHSLNLPAAYPTGEDTFGAWARTVCLDEVIDRMNFPGTFKKASAADMRGGLKLILEKGKNGLEELKQLSCYEDVVECLREWSFFQTEKGYFGFTHPEALPGDSVCVVLGCWAPLVLRPQVNDSWEVVGDCYLHGIMDGETLLGPLPPGFTVQIQVRNGVLHPFYMQSKSDAEGNVIKDLHNDDPRIGDLPEEWLPDDIGNFYRDADDPVFYMMFVNSKTKATQNHDPRLSPDKLRARGVPLRTFDLV